MSDGITIRLREDPLNKAAIASLTNFQKKALPRLTVAALNRTLTRAATRVRRELAKEKRVTQKAIKGRLKTYKAKVPDRMFGKLWVGTGRAVVKKNASSREILASLKGPRSGIFRIDSPRYQGRYVRYPLPSYIVGDRGGDEPNLPIRRVDKGKLRIDLMPEAEPITEKHVLHEQRVFFPRELKRLLDVAAKRRRRG